MSIVLDALIYVAPYVEVIATLAIAAETAYRIYQVVEIVIALIAVILGYDDQVLEYYEVHNIPLFTDQEIDTSLQETVLKSVRGNTSLIRDILYTLTWGGHKTNTKKFMRFIEDGNYFEPFPVVNSFILTIDYTELTAALATLNSVPCTPEQSALYSLDSSTWVKYWLQENKEYNVGTNTLGEGYVTTSTSPPTPVGDTVHVIPSVNHYDVNITSIIGTADDVLVDERWYVDFSSVTYNSTPDNYSVTVYNTPSLGSINRVLPYTIPSKPVQLHYISYYYRDSAPSRTYLFIYKVGEGTYTDLDVIENSINEDGTILQTMPAIPLRLSNSNFTTFGATKVAQIKSLCDTLSLDAESLIARVMTDPNSNPGDVDNVYVNFGVRMWDTSQTGMSYLFSMFENLYPSQGVTQGTYNNSIAGDEKPQNNIITTSLDNKQIFQWSYITYEHFSVSEINADSGSTENGIYYSDMSKFDSNNIIQFSYYVSSGKGTYNVGYKADTLAEVQDFLDGNGVINPGTTTTEAANWMQPTVRMPYNNSTPNLLNSDGTASTAIFITPDLVYENNGSGVLKGVSAASEATTVGQSITYYCCKPSGLDAYTVVAPIGALRVIDGDTAKFKFVKFNLGHKNDLMVPFIHTFVKDLSGNLVTRLLLKGCHLSIYIAHYEVIVPETMPVWLAIVLLIVIVVTIIVAIEFGQESYMWIEAIAVSIAYHGITHAVTQALILYVVAQIVTAMTVAFLIRLMIAEIAEVNEELALALSVIAAVGTTWYFSGSNPLTTMDYAQIFVASIDYVNVVVGVRVKSIEEELALETSQAQAEQDRKRNKLKAHREKYDDIIDFSPDYSNIITRVISNSNYSKHPELLYSTSNNYHEYTCTIPYAYEENITHQIESKPQYI
jgi:hypothetical protein